MKRFYTSVLAAFLFLASTGYTLGCSSCEENKGCPCNRPKPPRTRKDQIETAVDQVEEVTKGCPCNNRPKPPRTRKDQIDNSITAEISAGELIDKITILQIKEQNINDPEKLKNVRTELESLTNTKDKLIPPSDEVNELEVALLEINKKLWDIEDDIRDKENNKNFDQEFVQLARDVYVTNDQRSIVKKQINMLTGSRLVEEKSYAAY